jgi:predicted ArsR family transcriptional regulator
MPAWMEQMKAEHPELADRMAQRWGNMDQQQDQSAAGRPFARFQAARGGKPEFDKLGSGKLLDTLQKIVDILEVKLQYVQ